MYTTIALAAGVLLDFCLGDPYSMPHPVCLMGRWIHSGEEFLRKRLPETPLGEKVGGVLLWVGVVCLSCLLPAAILYGCFQIHPLLYCAAAAVMCYQCMATKCMRDESRKVYDALCSGDLERSRRQVAGIVGRDTDVLDAEGVAKAAVETVAENTSDGSIAPLFYLGLGGPVAGFFYKAVNTMDSMIGYRNEKYQYFGWFAARMDDVFNFIPARLSAILMVFAAFLAGMDGRAAWRIFRRDRRKSPSPNSAQTESVCAGALHVSLLGDTSYFGKIHHKESIGDDERTVEAEDILRANRLLYLTVMEGTALVLILRFLLVKGL